MFTGLSSLCSQMFDPGVNLFSGFVVGFATAFVVSGIALGVNS